MVIITEFGDGIMEDIGHIGTQLLNTHQVANKKCM